MINTQYIIKQEYSTKYIVAQKTELYHDKQHMDHILDYSNYSWYLQHSLLILPGLLSYRFLSPTPRRPPLPPRPLPPPRNDYCIHRDYIPSSTKSTLIILTHSLSISSCTMTMTMTTSIIISIIIIWSWSKTTVSIIMLTTISLTALIIIIMT